MTLILATIFLTVTLSYILYKPIRRYRYVLYALSIVVALVLYEEANMVSLGFVPLGIYFVVMMTGVLEKSKLQKRLYMVRRELSVIASILLLPHALGFGEFFLENLDVLYPRVFIYFGLIAAIVMIPLFITSFTFIRRMMNYKQWKKLHQLSYIAYGFIGLHLIFMQNERMVIYIILFGTYLCLKIWMVLQKRKRIKKGE